MGCVDGLIGHETDTDHIYTTQRLHQNAGLPLPSLLSCITGSGRVIKNSLLWQVILFVQGDGNAIDNLSRPPRQRALVILF